MCVCLILKISSGNCCSCQKLSEIYTWICNYKKHIIAIAICTIYCDWNCSCPENPNSIPIRIAFIGKNKFNLHLQSELQRRLQLQLLFASRTSINIPHASIFEFAIPIAIQFATRRKQMARSTCGASTWRAWRLVIARADWRATLQL